MAKLPTIAPRIPTLDTRTVKPMPKVADAELQTTEHRQWREQVLINAGFRCQAIEDGQRCDRRAPEHRMFADHVVERRDGGAPLDPLNGQCLCGKHHTMKTVRARTERLRG